MLQKKCKRCTLQYEEHYINCPLCQCRRYLRVDVAIQGESSASDQSDSASANDVDDSILDWVPPMDYISHHIGQPTDIENQLYELHLWDHTKQMHTVKRLPAWQIYKDHQQLLLQYHKGKVI